MPKNTATPIGSPRRTRTNALSPLTRMILWAKAAGRCQYSGCNKSLIGDLISGAEDRNFGFVAHIVADTPTGPRGDPVRSPLLSDDVTNLMLLCHVHHKLIDVDEVEQHPEDRLLAMKAAHEQRIEIVTAIDEDRASHVLRYAANIGGHEFPGCLRTDQRRNAARALPRRGSANNRYRDPAAAPSKITIQQFWKTQRENLNQQFNERSASGSRHANYAISRSLRLLRNRS